MINQDRETYCDGCEDRGKPVCKLPNQGRLERRSLGGPDLLSGLGWIATMSGLPFKEVHESAIDATVESDGPPPDIEVFIEVQRCIDKHLEAEPPVGPAE